ncbi:MAG: hypothetical protein Kow00120_17360 [Anaerolineae bacterium]
MRRILVVSLLLVGALLAACKGAPTPYQPPTETPAPAPPPTLPPPASAPGAYTLAKQTPDEMMAFLQEAVTGGLADAVVADRASLAEAVEVTAREVRSAAAGDAVRRAQAAWYAARAHHHAGNTAESLAWLRPAVLDSLNAGVIALAPPPHTLNVEGVTIEVAAHRDLNADSLEEWVLWLRFDTPPHESVAFVAAQQAGGYAVLPAEGGWPQVGGRGALLVEAVDDLNRDGLPEIAISAYTCGDAGCAGALAVFAWRGGQFARLTQPPEGIPLHDVSWAVADIDQDGLAEISLLAAHTDTFGWGCAWEEATIYGWDAVAGAYALREHITHFPPGDPACLMTQVERAYAAGNDSAAIQRLGELLALPEATLAALGADFPAFVRFRYGVAHARTGLVARAIEALEAARQESAYIDGLAGAFLDHYGNGATFHTACAAADYHAVTAPPTYDLVPVKAYGGLAPASVCPGGHDAIQRLIRSLDWRTDGGPLQTQLERAGIPLLGYVQANFDADADPEALALTRTDFPFLWLFDADASGAIVPTRVATAKRATGMRAFTHDLDSDAAPETFILIEMQDPFGARCLSAPTATLLRVVTFASGAQRTLLDTVDCRPVAELEAALRANPTTVVVINNLGLPEPAIYTYIWSGGGYVPAEPTAAPPTTPAAPRQPTDAERAQLDAVKDAMLERNDLAGAWSLLEPLLALAPEGAAPAVRFEARYLLGLWYERTGDSEAARQVYYQLWADAPDSEWGELARRRLSP